MDDIKNLFPPTWDFCVRLDELIEACLDGGNTEDELYEALLETAAELKEHPERYKK